MDTPDVFDVKPPKVKKPRTPAQVAATTKALSVLKERREALKKTQEDEVANADEEKKQEILKVKYEKAKRTKSKLPPIINYVTTCDLDRFKKEILQCMPKEVYRELPPKIEYVEKQKIEIIPKETIREVVKEVPVIKTLSGNALLDSIFFK
jgi:hypothetical protein